MAFVNTDVKSIFSSTTFWGAVVSLAATLVPGLLGIIGVGADAAGQASLVAHIVQIVGFAVTVYGRLTATQPAAIVPPSK